MTESRASTVATQPIPAAAGIGLRAPHHDEFLDRRPAVPWVEVHSENFFAAGGRSRAVLEAVRRDYAVSLHGVGLSLGSTDELDPVHLGHLRRLVEAVEPALVSEHLCWTSAGGVHLNDLLPLPYTREALDHLVSRVGQLQEALRRPVLLENVSSYLEFPGAEISEWEFLAEVARRSGCGILLDINNIWVSSCNHGFDPATYLGALPPAAVEELHLAGYEEAVVGEETVLIDTHSRPVSAPVWSLFRAALARFGPRPTLLEWDAELPSLDELLAEAGKAQRFLTESAPPRVRRA